LYIYREPIVLFPSLATLFYNSAQAHLFPAIMVHAAVKFGFTSTENGYIISLAAGTSSIYLFIVLYAIPQIRKKFGPAEVEEVQGNGLPGCETSIVESGTVKYYFTRDLFYALVSMSIQLIFLPFFAIAGTAREMYGLVVLIALGLAAPSFMKSYAITGTHARDSVMASIAVSESVGGLLSPIALGITQSVLGQGREFIVASSLVCVSMLCLIGSLLVRR